MPQFKVFEALDDAKENHLGAVDTGVAGAWLQLDSDAGHARWAGWIFGPKIPRGAVLTACTVEMNINTTKAEDINVRIYVQASDSPAQFTTTTNDISGRSRLAATVDWVAANVGTGYEVSPSIITPVQAWIDRGGHQQDSTIAILLNALHATDGSQHTHYEDGGAGANAPKLNVTYRYPAVGAVPISTDVA